MSPDRASVLSNAGRDQGAQDFHDDSFVLLTESVVGLGLPNEINLPDGAQHKATLPACFQHITKDWP